MPRPAEWTFVFFLQWTYSNSVKTKPDSMLKSQLLIKMKILVAQLCLTLWDPVNHSLPGSSLSMGLCRQEYWGGSPLPPPGDLLHPGMESTSIALASGFFTAKSPLAPHNLSMAFSRQEKESGLPFPSPVGLPYSGIEAWSPVLQVYSLPSEPPAIKHFFSFLAEHGNTVISESSFYFYVWMISLPHWVPTWETQLLLTFHRNPLICAYRCVPVCFFVS